MALTSRQIQRYLMEDGMYCPYCGDRALEWDRMETDRRGAYQEVRCLACGKTWTDEYQLSGLTEHDNG